ncbi:NAD+ diphosphatase [Pseudomonas duriflava]|uniref:NAD-capped RNA hydrolase NudC n=1 Tax=Pseudomonas duriflava TaxID=459528 RepID=A0A562Q8S6_9PSED|nr:NAD(+) diphosphatase [Pseudomonas duriflava]TWI53171.1 NAD+ diphosphatase [Pseudomonas duriflava]
MSRWEPGCIDLAADAIGHAIVHSPAGFLTRGEKAFFPLSLDVLKRLPISGQYGLGYFDGLPVMLCEVEAAAELEGYTWQALRPLMLCAEHDVFKMLGYASQIATWAAHHRFCGRCATPTRALKGQRGLSCPACGLTQYPRLSPSMIVLVTRGDEVLLARSPRFAPGVYSTMAGFVEPGESVEACVRREVREEVAVEVQNLRYLGSQSWPYPHSLMLGFHADYAGGEIICQPDEIEDARWFSLNNLPLLPPKQSISRYLIDLYLAQRLGLPEPLLPN